jgi:hypothetical protein
VSPGAFLGLGMWCYSALTVPYDLKEGEEKKCGDYKRMILKKRENMFSFCLASN